VKGHDQGTQRTNAVLQLHAPPHIVSPIGHYTFLFVKLMSMCVIWTYLYRCGLRV